MKTTKSKLVDFLSKHIAGDLTINDVSVALIESGLIEIEEEPKEFWVVIDDTFTTAFVDKHDAQEYIDSECSDEGKMLLTHSVDQCKKYEKMWEELKNNIGCYREDARFDSFTIVNMMNKLEKGE